jgi:hypothetical protein
MIGACLSTPFPVVLDDLGNPTDVVVTQCYHRGWYRSYFGQVAVGNGRYAFGYVKVEKVYPDAFLYILDNDPY